MDTSNERDELIMKAVVEMNGDWKTGIQNMRISSGIAECLFLDNRGYWATVSYWDHLCAGERATDGNLTPLCTIAEFEEAAAKWKEQQSLERPNGKIYYCPVNSQYIEAYKRLVGEQFGNNRLSKLESLISLKISNVDLAVSLYSGEPVWAAVDWYKAQPHYEEFKAPKANYEELTFGELPRDEKLKLVEHVLDGGVVERYYDLGSFWTDKFTGRDRGLLCFVKNGRYRIKHVEPVTEKELFLREAKHYESIEQMFDSGKFKLVDGGGEE